MLPYCFAVMEQLVAASGPPPAPATGRCRRDAAARAPLPEPDEEPDPLWHAVLEEVRGVLAPAAFARCLVARVLGREGDMLRIGLPDAMTCRWFDTRLRRPIEEALRSRAATGLGVQFVTTVAPYGSA